MDNKVEIWSIRTWKEKARENIKKWGLQDEPTLILAMMEELGELSQAYLQFKHESGNKDRIRTELDDLMALGIQLELKLRAFQIDNVTPMPKPDPEGDAKVRYL